MIKLLNEENQVKTVKWDKMKTLVPYKCKERFGVFIWNGYHLIHIQDNTIDSYSFQSLQEENSNMAVCDFFVCKKVLVEFSDDSPLDLRKM